MHQINNAYDAYHFLYSHPKFMLRERYEITPEEYDKGLADGYLVTKDRGGKCYREQRHLFRHAIEHNLDIFYAKVDETGRVNDDRQKNVNVECWLEFGQLEWGYMSGGEYDWDTETGLLNYHDVDLDTGGPTFDEALISLAKLVLEHHGDYEDLPYKEQRAKQCGETVPCADCRDAKAWARRHGLTPKDAPDVSPAPSTSEE
jgi:hypothetical protein